MALQADVYPDYENGMASAIVLRNFSRRTDLTYINEIVFDFSIDGTESASTVIFIVGNELSRAEFTLEEVEPGVIHRISCPVSRYNGRNSVAYVGVMVYSDDSAVLEIQKVKLESDTLTAAEIRALFDAPAEPEEKAGYTAYYLSGMIAVLSVFVTALMIRRDREDSELREEEEQALRKKRRVY